ncbi:MAG: FmdB family zinc ribbon protein [Anaerolineae bacterium]
MPVYEYECDSCSLRFEKMQRFSDDPVRSCPHCGELVHRVIQPVGVIFKGSGFYVTDNRGKSSTMPPAKREGEGKSEGDAKGDSQSDAKSDSRSDAKPSEAKTPAKSTESAAS